MAARQPSSRVRPTDLIQFWPRLTRFYGIPPHVLQHYPAWLILEYCEAMPRLIAEETSTALMVADFPWLERGDRARVHRSVSSVLDEESVRRADATTEVGKRTINSMGIGVRVPRKGVTESA